MIEFNGVDETTFGLTVKNITKSAMAPIENRIIRKTAGDGSFNFGSYFGNYEILVEFHDKVSPTPLAFFNNMLNINAWLYPLDKQAKVLTLTGAWGEGGLYHLAKVEGSTDISTILEYGKFEVLFVCTDPFKKGASHTIATLASPVVNAGTMLGRGIFTATFSGTATQYNLLDVTTGYYIRFNYNFVLNDVLVLDTDKQSAYLNGTTNMLPYLDLTSRFFDIQIGSNTITDTSTPASRQVTSLVLSEQYL
jgi:phage-related protein